MPHIGQPWCVPWTGGDRPTSVVVTTGPSALYITTQRAPSLWHIPSPQWLFSTLVQWVAMWDCTNDFDKTLVTDKTAVNWGGVLQTCFTYRGCSQVHMRWWENLPSWMRLEMLWRRRGPTPWSSPSRTGPSPRLRPASASISSWSPETQRGTRPRSCPGTFPPQSSTLYPASISITPTQH